MNESFKLKGSIYKIYPLEKKGVKSFKIRKLILLINETKYQQYIEITFLGEKTTDLENFIGGEQVVVDINLKGREWAPENGEKRYFNTLEGWKISEEIDKPQITEDEENDLPF